MSEDRPYEGKELELFARARNWKAYWSAKVRPHLGKSVLEVGAGLGANTPFLLGPEQTDWLCLEPDAALAAQIPATLAGVAGNGIVKTRTGTLRDLAADETFDTILYIDVLEHIEDDLGEMRAALGHLSPGGKIVVLSPAHPWLFTEFDRTLGHYRRYTARSLRACTPAGAALVEIRALDSMGLMASVANKLLLHQNMPSPEQIAFWDRCLVSLSCWTDPLLGFSVGKSLIAVWRKDWGPVRRSVAARLFGPIHLPIDATQVLRLRLGGIFRPNTSPARRRSG
ncbi:MAG: class I SAM-dependent methyltransferase [Methylacidiphilales bacterium]|nr:class I SAM-dependent methyltransferase [Candidatus Methylacidiphilales bacterium]